MRTLPLVVWMVLALLVLIEVAVLVPVIVTQRAKEETLASDQLVMLTKDLAQRLEKTIASFMYNVVRAAAAAPASGFLSQRSLEDALQIEEDPRNTPATLYFWVPLVSASERPACEQFYGQNITQLSNGTGSPIIPIPRDTNRTVFAPYTIFVPRLPPPPATNPVIYGFDLLPFNMTATSVIFKNASKYLSIPSGLVNRTQNNYGFVAVAQNKYGRGYMFGRVGSRELLEFSLTVPRQYVTLATFVLSSNATRQALFYDDSPLLGNATNVAIFNSLSARSEFYTANFSSFGELIMVAVRYDPQYVAQFAGHTWVILAAVLAPVCFLIDVIWITLALLWQRKRHLHELEQRKRKEAQVMICYVNHEIRNPLQTILGLADMQLERAENEERDHLLASEASTIVRAAEFIEHIARDILDLHRVEDGKLDLEMSDVEVGVLVNDLKKAAVPLLTKKRGIEFVVCLDPDITVIHSDRYRLEQILLNFLTNAVKHTEHGAITLSFSFVAPTWIRISVADTGAGIALEKKEKLFERFSQSSARDASELGGFGLGLHLTKMLAQLLGGKVGFDSTLGDGSEFWVDLPVARDSTCLDFQFDESEIPLQSK